MDSVQMIPVWYTVVVTLCGKTNGGIVIWYLSDMVVSDSDSASRLFLVILFGTASHDPGQRV